MNKRKIQQLKRRRKMLEEKMVVVMRMEKGTRARKQKGATQIQRLAPCDGAVKHPCTLLLL